MLQALDSPRCLGCRRLLLEVQSGFETAPTLRISDEGTLGAGKHQEALFDKLPEGRWCKDYTFGGVKVTPLVGFRPLDQCPSPTWESSKYLLASLACICYGTVLSS
jgi:hypothetical protein